MHGHTSCTDWSLYRVLLVMHQKWTEPKWTDTSVWHLKSDKWEPCTNCCSGPNQCQYAQWVCNNHAANEDKWQLHPKDTLRDCNAMNAVYVGLTVCRLFTLSTSLGSTVELTVCIPFLIALCSSCSPSMVGMTISMFKCSILYGWRSHWLSAQRSSPWLPLAFWHVHATWPITVACTGINATD